MSQENPTPEELNRTQETKEKTAYTEEDFYKEISEQEKRYLEIADLNDDEVIKRDISQIQRSIAENYKNMDSRERKKAIAFSRFGNFRKLLPGCPWGDRFSFFNRTPKQRKKLIEAEMERGKFGRPNFEQICNDIDKIIVNLGYNLEEVKKWGEIDKEYETHVDDLVKIYCAMRNLGYKHYPDLSQ